MRLEQHIDSPAGATSVGRTFAQRPSKQTLISELPRKIKAILLGPAATLIILVCSFIPRLRPCFSRLGITPARFGRGAVRVPIAGRSTRLAITGAGTCHLSFQLFWRGINYYEPFTRTVIEMLTASRELF